MDSSISVSTSGELAFIQDATLRRVQTAISVVCLADNGRHDFVRNLFGAGSSNEGLGLFSFGLSWTLITQGSPLVWPWQTRVSSFVCPKLLFDYLKRLTRTVIECVLVCMTH